MTQPIEANQLISNAQFAIVVSRFNEFITKQLLAGAVDTFRQHGANENDVTTVWVPGAFEIPQIAQQLAKSKKYQAICCLGAVIQGETDHHEYINHAVANAIMDIGQQTGIPVTFGILTCQSLEQAINRAGGKSGNKGREAALTAIEMVNLQRQLQQ